MMKIKMDNIKKKIKNHKKTKKETTEQKLRNASFDLVEVIVIIVITSVIVGVTSGFIVYKNYDVIDKNYNLDRSSKALNEFIDTYNNILESYVEEVDGEKLIGSAIEAMFNNLSDPYTSYLDKDTTSDLQEKLKGEYQGIGVEIYKITDTGFIYVNEVFNNSPAQIAGLKAGDIITKVDGIDVVDKTALEISSIIKGKGFGNVLIEYNRGEEKQTAEIGLSNVIIPSVESKMFDEVGYVRLSTFSNTTVVQLKAALEQLESNNLKGLIIDVRGNTGGYLNAAKDIAELFIKKDSIIYQLESKGVITEIYKDKTVESRDYEVVVLMDKLSASASEILAAALKDSYGATLVGTTTYGKGSVQETSSLSSGEMIKYTTAYWLTPTGNKINGVGISPDIVINYLPSEGEYSYETDNQLQVAIKAIIE